MTKLKNSVYLISSKEDNTFWTKMGIFFASKEVRKEFYGYPLNDSDLHKWFVVLDKDENVKAFLGANFEKVEKNKEVWLTELYTLTEHRQKGLAETLLSTALNYFKENKNIETIKIVDYPDSFANNLFKKYKFRVDFMKGE